MKLCYSNVKNSRYVERVRMAMAMEVGKWLVCNMSIDADAIT